MLGITLNIVKLNRKSLIETETQPIKHIYCDAGLMYISPNLADERHKNNV
jgi:CMP-N-acetylneuraminic acid synthetase